MSASEKPIFFQTEMVQAIMEGRKTKTRRVIKPAKRNHRGGFKQGNGLWIDGYGPEECPNGHIKDYSVSSVWQRKDYYIKDFAPYKPGDILWVRETWASHCDECQHNQGTGYKDATCIFVGDCERFTYKASDNVCPGGKWRPSIHMPREAARIFLKVKSVRMERLQDIMPDDVLKEGLIDVGTEVNALDMFAELWDSIYAKSGYDWNVNPWVWVVEFERLTVKEVNHGQKK